MRDFRKARDQRRRGRRWPSLLLAAVTASALAGGSYAAFIVARLPSPEEFFSRRITQSTKIYDRTGSVLLYEIHGEERRTVIPYGEIPAAVKNATVAIEDAGFWRHAGIDARGIVRALMRDLASGDLREGGSTITQQLVKNSLLGHERTIRRKVREAIYALVLESRLSKERILDLYLNQIPYGQNAYGIEAAAQTFFGRHARDLSTRQAAVLAALPAAPSYYSPYGQHKNELLRRADRAIARMAELGYVTEQEAASAGSEPLDFLPAAKNIRAPHFVMYVRDYLIERYGEEEVESGGLIVTTTLDWNLQEAAEAVVSEYAERNESLIRAHNMALVAANPKSGDILAMVGSRDYFDLAGDGNFNVATALRQPGSAFKPFVYATAFKKGLTPETVVFDVPIEFNPGCAPDGTVRLGSGARPGECYHPANYDETFRGPVSLRQAMAQSLNVPSVKVLYLAGIEDSIRTAEDFGLTTLKDRSRFGLSLVLGGAEVRLLEMTSAYGVLANDGILNAPTVILKVIAADGRLREEKRVNARPVIDTDVARTISSVLSDNDARIPVFQPRSSLYFPDRAVAVKTGTTQDFRDAWTIGYTPSIAVGVWAGNNDNAPMQQKGSGVMAAAPAWHRFMETALASLPPEGFPAPTAPEGAKPILRGIWQGDEVVTIDTVSGKLATDLTPPESRNEVAFGEPHDTLYWIDRHDPAGPPPADPSSDPQYPNWEASFQAWRAASGFRVRSKASMPKSADDVHTPDKQPRLSVQKTPVGRGTVKLSIAVESLFGLREVSVLSGDQVLASRTRPSSPLEFLFEATAAAASGGTLEVRAYDRVGNIGSAIVTLP